MAPRYLLAALVMQMPGTPLAVRTQAGSNSAWLPSWEEVTGSLPPPCVKKYKLREFVEGAKQWCDPNLVPEERRAPKKLQGLYWLKGLPLPDFAACLSTGTWDEATRTLVLSVWRDFIFAKEESFPYALGFHYNITFIDSTLSEAMITPVSKGNDYQQALGTVPLQVFSQLAEFPMIEEPGSNGEKWSRPSYFHIGPKKQFTNEYSLWRVMDGEKEINMASAELMYEMVGRMHDGDETEAYHQYDKPCNL